MSDKLFNEDAAMLLYWQWCAAQQPKKGWLLLDLWRLAERLAKNRIYTLVAFFLPHFGFEDWLALLKEKFVKVITKYFNPKRAKLYSLLFKSFDNCIKTKLKQLSRGKNKQGVPIVEYDSENLEYREYERQMREWRDPRLEPKEKKTAEDDIF
jgi:hypothetical protein